MLITGVSGLLGNNLAYYFKYKYDILGLYNSHQVYIDNVTTQKCDLFNNTDIEKILLEYDPEIVIHCASLTDIDDCESDKSRTKSVNILATKRIVDSLINKNAKLLYISTDSVYDGIKGNFFENENCLQHGHYGSAC